jgi:hypothetical protein
VGAAGRHLNQEGQHMNKFVDWDDLGWAARPYGASALILDQPTQTLERLLVEVHRVDPGAAWDGGATSAERILVVKSGAVSISVAGQAKDGETKTSAFVRSEDPLVVSCVGAEPAEVYVTEFTTAETGDPAKHNPPGESLQSAVWRWEEGAVELGGPESTFLERRSFVPPSKTLTSPRVSVHAQLVGPATPEAYYGGHPDICLFFMLTGGFEFNVPDVVHRTGAGSFLYLAEEAPHGQTPFTEDVTGYFVVHVWSRVSQANAFAAGQL